MTLSVCSFSSGSSGNCYLIKTEKAAVLIDAGISATRILKELDRTETSREKVKALFFTHEHHDHITGARVLLKKLASANVYASQGTFEGIVKHRDYEMLSLDDISKNRRFVVAPYEPVTIEDITVYAFRTLHDAIEPYGYHICSSGKRIAILTDTGVVTDEMIECASDADVFILESNHDTEILRRGSYPWYLKRRILSDYGHLSNSQAADVLLRLFAYSDKKRVVLLAHLSDENNTPAIAEQTVLTALARENRYTGSDFYLGVLLRSEASLLFTL